MATLSRKDAHAAYVEDRLKSALIPLSLLGRVVDGSARIECPGLPPDAAAVRCFHDVQEEGVMVVFAHPAFRRVARGEKIPRLGDVAVGPRGPDGRPDFNEGIKYAFDLMKRHIDNDMFSHDLR